MIKVINSINDMTVNSRQRTTFAQAIRDKYIEQPDIQDKVVLPKDERISTDITFVGFGKLLSVQKQLIKLTNIDLSNKNIETAGCFDDFKTGLNRVRILNLADNVLTWKEVLPIIYRVPGLSELILSNNPLFDAKVDEDNKPQLELSSITLGHIYYDWSCIIEQMAKALISVEKIDLWHNRLNEENMIINTKTYDTFIEKIRVLSLSHNYFENIDWLKSIGPIHNLVELDLSNCGIQVVNFDKDSIFILKNLKDLNISYNELGDWRSISNLYYLKSLRNLICHENPIFITDKFSKYTTIALLGQIVTINREEITKNVRNESELYYIRSTFSKYLTHKKEDYEGFRKSHPRYEELLDIYGVPEDLVKKQEVDKYVTISLCFESRKITKKLPRDMKVAKVEMLCKKLFNLRPSANITLICTENNGEKPEIRYKLDNEGQTLHYFSVENGCELQIELTG